MSLTPTNHAHGVLHVIVDATGNNSLNAFLIIFTDLIERCLAWDSGSHLHLTFWSFFSNDILLFTVFKVLFLYIETLTNKVV